MLDPELLTLFRAARQSRGNGRDRAHTVGRSNPSTLSGLGSPLEVLMICVCSSGRRRNGPRHPSARREPANCRGMCYKGSWKRFEKNRRTPRSLR